MAKLSAARRRALPARDFALGKGHFPIEDRGHARAALSGATRARRAGNITAAEAAHVRRLVHERYPNIGKGR